MNPTTNTRNLLAANPAGIPIRLNRLLGVLVLPFTLAACAPHSWGPEPGFDAYLNKVQQVCGNQRIGSYQIGWDLLNNNNDAAFLDATSRLYYGKISRQDYASYVAVFANTTADSPGISCVISQLPPQP